MKQSDDATGVGSVTELTLFTSSRISSGQVITFLYSYLNILYLLCCQVSYNIQQSEPWLQAFEKVKKKIFFNQAERIGFCTLRPNCDSLTLRTTRCFLVNSVSLGRNTLLISWTMFMKYTDPLQSGSRLQILQLHHAYSW